MSTTVIHRLSVKMQVVYTDIIIIIIIIILSHYHYAKCSTFPAPLNLLQQSGIVQKAAINQL